MKVPSEGPLCHPFVGLDATKDVQHKDSGVHYYCRRVTYERFHNCNNKACKLKRLQKNVVAPFITALLTHFGKTGKVINRREESKENI